MEIFLFPHPIHFTKIILTQIKESDIRFTSLGHARNIWAVSAIHGNIDRLVTLHDTLFPHISAGDRIIYTGNYTGYGENSNDVISELLTFRRAVLAKQSMIPTDLIYLRGAQEEMWQKLLQLQFSPDPMNTFLWMLGNGLGKTLYAYGLSPHDGIEACNQGMVGISQWTNRVRETLTKNTGHRTLSMQLVRAAYSPEDSEYPMLFVNAGIDTQKPLQEQGDNFWWGHRKFNQIDAAYAPFQKVIRGYDPDHNGIDFNCVKATIDGGCGFGGSLVCAGFGQDGKVLDTLEC